MTSSWSSHPRIDVGRWPGPQGEGDDGCSECRPCVRRFFPRRRRWGAEVFPYAHPPRYPPRVARRPIEITSRLLRARRKTRPGRGHGGSVSGPSRPQERSGSCAKYGAMVPAPSSSVPARRAAPRDPRPARLPLRLMTATRSTLIPVGRQGMALRTAFAFSRFARSSVIFCAAISRRFSRDGLREGFRAVGVELRRIPPTTSRETRLRISPEGCPRNRFARTAPRCHFRSSDFCGRAAHSTARRTRVRAERLHELVPGSTTFASLLLRLPRPSRVSPSRVHQRPANGSPLLKERQRADVA